MLYIVGLAESYSYCECWWPSPRVSFDRSKELMPALCHIRVVKGQVLKI